MRAKSVVVELTPDECADCSRGVTFTNEMATKYNAKGIMDVDGNALSIPAKFAFCKWRSLSSFRLGIDTWVKDIKNYVGLLDGCRIQARSSLLDCMIVRPGFLAHENLVLSIVELPRVYFMGWRNVGEVRNGKFYFNDRLPAPGYEVGQLSLYDMDTLPKETNGTIS